MIMRSSVASVTIAAMLLASCGGGGGGGSTAPVSVAPTPAPTSASAGCSLSERQAFARDVINEWYLFPAEVATATNPASFNNIDDYIDALVAPARASGKDRFFTYITSIAEENAFFSSGASAGFGVRLSFNSSARRLFIAEAYEGAPALTAGIDRGTEIVAIGTSASNLRTIGDIVAAEGSAGINAALGPNTAGLTRVLRINNGGGNVDVTVTKADFSIDPISDRYGATIIEDGGRRYGYLNLRTFISSADAQLRAAFQNFRDQGITELIIDFRYNGGGLVSTAELMGDLMGRNRFTSEIFSRTDFRPEKASNNEIDFFAPQSQSVAPTRIAFIGTGSTASASEFVINGMLPYLGSNMALVGANTFGKPVGQIALDRAACDDRMRVVAFSTGNAAGTGDYFNGLASKVQQTCAAADSVSFPLGDARETSIRAAIDFLAGRSCTAIADASVGAQSATQRSADDGSMTPLVPAAPSAAQREIPGLF
ncbi:MAG: peptidase S41 [Sphingopyxis sp.]|nr:peptidase S41 [Sphingopyxis sp.]